MTQKNKVGELKTQNDKFEKGEIQMNRKKTEILIKDIPQLIRPPDIKKPKIVAIYLYKDENGNVLYELVRQREGEPYACRKPIGDGKYEYSIKGVRRVIYNLQEIIQAIKKQEVIFITEGESKVETLKELGIPATTVFSKYPNKWNNDYNNFLLGAAGIIILQDDDKNGIDFSNNTYATLREIFPKEKIGILPITSICPEINKQGADITDVRDFMNDDEKLTLILKTIADQI